jgi:NAD(P)-dependent dehydrogenase (short-subunit alcohol dehydrogenase family)
MGISFPGMKVIVISISSDIGISIGSKWLADGVEIVGTYRRYSENVAQLSEKGAKLVLCDLSQQDSVTEACSKLRSLCSAWDILVMCPGLQEPIGPFVNVEFDQWESSVRVNFVSQIRIIRELLPVRRTTPNFYPTVLLFAGGGPNKATTNYSAYAVSKVALIKMCELLDAEMPDTRFVIVNPGWVKTKGHESMLKAGEMGGDDYRRMLEKMRLAEWVPMEKVVECCEWAIQAPRNLVGGRYFGVDFDEWGTDALYARLAEDTNLCKLRRCE